MERENFNWDDLPDEIHLAYGQYLTSEELARIRQTNRRRRRVFDDQHIWKELYHKDIDESEEEITDWRSNYKQDYFTFKSFLKLLQKHSDVLDDRLDWAQKNIKYKKHKILGIDTVTSYDLDYKQFYIYATLAHRLLKYSRDINPTKIMKYVQLFESHHMLFVVDAHRNAEMIIRDNDQVYHIAQDNVSVEDFNLQRILRHIHNHGDHVLLFALKDFDPRSLNRVINKLSEEASESCTII